MSIQCYKCFNDLGYLSEFFVANKQTPVYLCVECSLKLNEEKQDETDIHTNRVSRK